ncbi:MAG TPA: hypothetical protein VFX75_01230 [Nitrososphaeraceae archaeon]|nr:hypothetical protein [Nitrososphaeraceae archaeon]
MITVPSIPAFDAFEPTIVAAWVVNWVENGNLEFSRRRSNHSSKVVPD